MHALYEFIDFLKMKNLVLTYLFLMIYSSLFCQSRTLLAYELETGITDTIANVFMPDLNCDKSDYYIGDFNQSIATLPLEIDTANLFHDSQWTYKKPVHVDFNINDFPFRTSAKIFTIEEDSLILNCSGSMVGPKHLLTASHCFTYDNLEFLHDSIFVCPAYDKGEFNSLFECSLVKKIYVFEDWNFNGEDFAILELEDNIGYQTGWISIGFDNELKYKDELLHKFSYPNWGNAPLDSIVFNGDTLYHSFGYADIFDEFNIGFTGAVAVPGESGSSIIQIVDDEIYTSYGVSTWVEDLKHSRMRKQYYYPIYKVITNENTSSTESQNSNIDWTIYPNPAKNQIGFSSVNTRDSNLTIRIHDLRGRLLLKVNRLQHEDIDISFLPNGIYLIRIGDGKSEKLIKFIKSSN